MHTHTKEFLDSLTPYQAYEVLIDGNKRFVSNLKMNRNLLQIMNETANGQCQQAGLKPGEHFFFPVPGFLQPVCWFLGLLDHLLCCVGFWWPGHIGLSF